MRFLLFGSLLLAGAYGAVPFAHRVLAAPGNQARLSPAPNIPPAKSASDDYVDPHVCAGCHQQIAQSYATTGMGRSFSVASPAAHLADFSGTSVDNQPSGMHYAMVEHDGKLFERRSQTGFRGRESNIVEEQVDYVIGSGNHARTFLHRDAQGRLIELPVSWYSENSGYWAMSPGYDRRDQDDFRRAIPAECMFCHNAYPQPLKSFNAANLDPPAFPKSLPEGIDCQRCHGPGGAHVKAAISGASVDAIRAAIVNPARLSRDRQLEVCMQCHLETSSSHMPNEIRLFNRTVFSYRPGQPLSEYKWYFDPVSNQADDRFEIAHAAYRLRMSACFRNSQMTCLTCHDPHKPNSGQGTTERYVAVCESCHQAVKHTVALPQTSTCLDCHMPKRRTDDAVHVVMTDHYIQRVKPDRDLLAPLAETANRPGAKAGVVLYYPTQLPQTGQSELYLELADVEDGSKGEAAIAKLQEDISKYAPAAPEFYYELAHAYSQAGNQSQAIRWYQEALRRKPVYPVAAKELAVSLLAENRAASAEEILRKAAAASPEDSHLLTDLGNVDLREKRVNEAEDVLLRSLQVDPVSPQAENLLGLIAVQRQQRQEAEKRFRSAIRDDPALAEAHYNLGNLLSSASDYDQAAYQFQKATAIDPQYAAAHHGLGLMLELSHSYDKAVDELQQAVHLDPKDAEAHGDLADLLAARGQLQDAEAQYRSALTINPVSAGLHASLGSVLAGEGKQSEAMLELEKAVTLQPDLYEAHLELALLLAKTGRNAEARAECTKASGSPDGNLRQDALNLLRQLGR
jgi:predicted CXXCH cytochrome family protein